MYLHSWTSSPLLLDFQSFELSMQDSHRTLYCTKTWYHLYISGGLQKMLTDLFNLVWNTQKKSKWTIFFECPVKMFLSIKKVLEKISEHQPYCFSPHF